MSEIDRMYENVGIAKTGIRKCTTCEYLDCQNYCFISENNKCDKFSYQYPPFTAEKQISILQFCLKWGQVHILKGIDNEYRIENSCYRQGYQPTIADAIANYINEKWEKLTPEEKQQVKGILE